MQCKTKTLAQYQTRLLKAAKDIASIRKRLYGPADFSYDWRAEFNLDGELVLETEWAVRYFPTMSFTQVELNKLEVIEQHILRANDPKAALRQQALEKLTREEREALGV